MNVTFHTLSALATSAVLSSKNVDEASRPSTNRVLLVVVGFVAGILLHGVLDFLPHTYPIGSVFDVVLSLILFAAGFALVKPNQRLLVGSCFLGAILPDLVDLGPPILNNRLGWSIPVVKVFPWHWHKYSGSIYDGSRGLESLVLHLMVIGVTLSLLYICRKTLLRPE